ncbi:RrF2 family transcriptional regulator [Aegicerativicinus sediminis]|uniref:RrF2 family transcriptional regulator n=1 Tax=Aegicerativicinus sediminis TaxID=2893202 RepID=UPI001E5E3F6A|nr:Rrf2 family transcriptional regulator [Aegicerativicinus sediminis]
MFSKACEYAIRAMIYIAKNSLEGKRVNPKEISAEINSPQAFTAKILQALVRKNVVKSIKGAYGGFEIDKENIPKITLSIIVETIDGDDIYKGCGLGLQRCNEENPCPLHDRFTEVRHSLRLMLENTTLEVLVDQLEKGNTVLKLT